MMMTVLICFLLLVGTQFLLAAGFMWALDDNDTTVGDFLFLLCMSLIPLVGLAVPGYRLLDRLDKRNIEFLNKPLRKRK